MLLPATPSHHAHALLNTDAIARKLATHRHKQLQLQAPLDWDILVQFTTPISENKLKTALNTLLDRRISPFPSAISVVAITETQAKSGRLQTREIPLFEGEKDTTTTNGVTPKKPPLRFRRICVSVALVTPCMTSSELELQEYEFDAEVLEEKDLKLLEVELKKACTALDKGAKLTVPVKPAKAAKFAQQVAQVLEDCDHTVGFRLIGPWNYQQTNEMTGTTVGVMIWDALLALGLQYDPDRCIFSFDLTVENLEEEEDKEEDEEDDSDTLFTVSTSSFPGQLCPTLLADPNYVLDDLQFECYVPYCPLPVDIVGMMLSAAHYVQQQVGGHLVDFGGHELDEVVLQQDVHNIVQSMVQCGVPPGSPQALYLF